MEKKQNSVTMVYKWMFRINDFSKFVKANSKIQMDTCLMGM